MTTKRYCTGCSAPIGTYHALSCVHPGVVRLNQSAPPPTAEPLASVTEAIVAPVVERTLGVLGATDPELERGRQRAQAIGDAVLRGMADDSALTGDPGPLASGSAMVCVECGSVWGTLHGSTCSVAGLVRDDNSLVSRARFDDGVQRPSRRPRRGAVPKQPTDALVDLIEVLAPYPPNVRERLIAAAQAFLQVP
ncbi:MAG: hypothetical protein E6R03_18490 [Hyphomicrobiaceae bacterium]|nr:MAG: hypothetical protein E6R03_18490 [Hyphomicrobiaceae bacterium]